ncbi:MAG: DUF3147 family protein [Verrucomicrobiaceae bacterium]|nr:MAG: DUF3147 family protein [Verrucomicrobiaceae bacterium]
MNLSFFTVVKFLLSALVITLVTEAVKRSDKMGALLASLPFVTVISMLWIYHEAPTETRVEKVSTHAQLVFWYVLPTLPMFLVFPWMARQWGFYGALIAGAVLTVGLFVLTRTIAGKYGISL